MTGKYLEFALGIAEEAGDIIQRNFTLNMEKQWKADGTPVTETDLRINSLVLQRVGDVFPAH